MKPKGFVFCLLCNSSQVQGHLKWYSMVEVNDNCKLGEYLLKNLVEHFAFNIEL